MKKALYVDCCIRGEESRTAKLAKSFLDNLQGYEIKHLDLMKENLQPLTGDFFKQRQALLDKGEYDHPRFKYAHEFADADLVIMAAPFWDLNFPALLKIYIENISVDHITFGSTENGLTGLCKANHLVYLTTRGGIYKDGEGLETATTYLKAFMPFYGFKNFDCVAANGLDIVGYDGEKDFNEAKEKAKQLAIKISNE